MFQYWEKYMYEFLYIEINPRALGVFCFVWVLFPALPGVMLLGKTSGISIKLPLGCPGSWNFHPGLYLFYKIFFKRRNDGRSSALSMLGCVIPLCYKLHKIYDWSEQTCLQTNWILHFHLAKRWNLGCFKDGFLSCESVSGDNLMSGF